MKEIIFLVLLLFSSITLSAQYEYKDKKSVLVNLTNTTNKSIILDYKQSKLNIDAKASVQIYLSLGENILKINDRKNFNVLVTDKQKAFEYKKESINLLTIITNEIRYW